MAPPRSIDPPVTLFLLRWWVPFVASTAGGLAILSLGPARDAVWQQPTLAFVAVLALTGACAVGAVAVLVLGFLRRLPEVALLACSLWAVSVLPLVHGLLLPGHLYGANPGTSVAVMIAVPAALLAGLPLLLDGTPAGLWLALRWRTWTGVWATLAGAGGAVLLVWPNLVPTPSGGWTTAIVAVSLAGTAVLSLRHLRLFALGRRAGSLLASLGFIAPGLATIAFLGAAPLSAGWWLAHLVDGVGVLFAAGGLAWAHWRDRSLAFVLQPVLAREPLRALELGLTPVVHDFIATLERKDAVTREHVVRVAELAMRAGERAGLDAVALRAVGLGGLLHDVGKLLTPAEILSKPGALTSQDRAVVERHPVEGAALLAPYPHLSEVAAIVRLHHERPDGRGYPHGLRGRQIPAAASIVSVVDAWDAMTSDRPYRDGMPIQRAEEILRDGAGTQWLPAAIDAVLSETRATGPIVLPFFRAVGRADVTTTPGGEEDFVNGCLPERAA